jgi:hypothetical protein
MDVEEGNYLRRLRRRANKLGELGMRIDRARPSDGDGYWLFDAKSNFVVLPRSSGRCCSLEEIEEEIAEREKNEGVEEQRRTLRELQGRARKLGLQVTTMRRHIGYWVIDRKNSVVPGGQELTLDRLARFLSEYEREASKKKGMKAKRL